MIKTFRGLLADGGQDRIRLQTIKGKVGYRITKLEVIANQPGIYDEEIIMKIYKTEQSSINGIIDFTDSDLLAGCFWQTGSAPTKTGATTVVFDNQIFNQDIFVTSDDVGANAQPLNYYLELEVIPLDDAGAQYTTLKDMRQV